MGEKFYINWTQRDRVGKVKKCHSSLLDFEYKCSPDSRIIRRPRWIGRSAIN